MNTKSFLYFSTLARELNITHAAQKLGITQQALSAQIARLEKHYDVQLFKRAPKFELTYAGERLLKHCLQFNIWNARLEGELQEIHDGERGQVFIGTTAKRGFTTIPLVFPTFHKEFPNIEVCLVEGNVPEFTQDLLNERTDFVIAISQIKHPDIVTLPIGEERSVLFVSDSVLRKYCAPQYDYLLAHKHTALPISFFKTCPFILNAANNRVRKNCEELFASYNIVPNVIFSSSNAMNLAELATLGLGATILNSSTPPSTVQSLHRFQIDGLSNSEILKISYLRSHYLSRPARRFIELTRELLPKNTTLPQNPFEFELL